MEWILDFCKKKKKDYFKLNFIMLLLQQYFVIFLIEDMGDLFQHNL